jgi:hypothetical protein
VVVVIKEEFSDRLENLMQQIRFNGLKKHILEKIRDLINEHLKEGEK